MTKPARSPILGYNHNIQFHGRVFHVQTEDSGMARARLFTHLFFEGTILASKKHEYDADSPEDVVRLLMQRLHKAMIKELKEGVHDPRIEGFFTARGETIQRGDRPTLVRLPEGPGVAAAVAPTPVVLRPLDDRPLAVSGSIDTAHPPARPSATSVPAPARPVPPVKRVVVVKPPEIRRPPVVTSSSAEGVVVRRNVVINVGGGTPPVQGQISRGNAAPRPAVPYVVREGSYPAPTIGRGSGPHAAGPTPPPTPASGGEAPPLTSTRDIRMPWDGPPTNAVDAAMRTRTPGAPPERTPAERALAADAAMRARTPAPPSERTPAERAFSSDLPSDKSLDEVILEYLSDDAE
jgi:hypothetical protein